MLYLTYGQFRNFSGKKLLNVNYYVLTVTKLRPPMSVTKYLMVEVHVENMNVNAFHVELGSVNTTIMYTKDLLDFHEFGCGSLGSNPGT